jgi:hypothetical protein
LTNSQKKGTIPSKSLLKLKEEIVFTTLGAIYGCSIPRTILGNKDGTSVFDGDSNVAKENDYVFLRLTTEILTDDLVVRALNEGIEALGATN